MELFSIIFFLIVMYGFGSSAPFIAKESEEFLERHLMRIGLGLGLMLTFGFLLNLIRIPLDWRIFLLAAVAVLAIKVIIDYRKKELFNVKLNFNIYALLMLVLFAATLFMYTKGAFAYPYLEDDDPWSHAVGSKFVSIEKTVFAGKNSVFHYIDPYPPAYDMLFGIIHQTNDSIYWTLKFFNALIISLCIIFFYYFAKQFTGSSKKAFYSAFALFAVPAFLSHFIWAIALTMPLFLVSFYCAEKIKDGKRWWIVSALVIMPTVTSSPTHSTYFGLFFVIYLIGKLIAERRLLIYEPLAGVAGVALSFALWWIPIIMVHTFKRVVEIMGPRATTGILGVGGTGDRPYGLSDFLCQPGTGCYNGQNMINNPAGIGIILSILAIIGLIYVLARYREMLKKENYYLLVLVLWFFFAFYAVNAANMPVKLSPFRAWLIFAIPLSLVAGEAINFLVGIIKSFSAKLSKMATMILVMLFLGILFSSIVFTSFTPKYKVNVNPNWPPGGFWTSNEEVAGYVWFKDNIPPDSKVFTFSNNGLIIGLDKFICHWCPDVRDFQKTGFNKTTDEISSWLKANEYDYMVVDGQTAQKIGLNQTSSLLQGLSGKHNIQQVTPAFFIVRV